MQLENYQVRMASVGYSKVLPCIFRFSNHEMAEASSASSGMSIRRNSFSRRSPGSFPVMGNPRGDGLTPAATSRAKKASQ